MSAVTRKFDANGYEIFDAPKTRTSTVLIAFFAGVAWGAIGAIAALHVMAHWVTP